jgi:two-component system OmpR family sensor kinase
VTLRARLLIGLLALVAAGMLIGGAVVYRQQKQYLYDQVDKQLQLSIGSRDTEQTMVRSIGGRAQLNPLGGDVVAEIHTPDGLTGSASTPNYNSVDLPDNAQGWFTIASPHIRGYATYVDGDRVILGISLADVDHSLHNLFLVELFVTIAVLVALAAMAWYGVNIGLRPLKKMEATAGRIAAGDLTQRVEVEDPTTEVGRLGMALNEMMTQIEGAFAERSVSEARLRRFVGDASHELRTPLTSIRGYAELFRRGAAERPEDLEKVMRRIEEEADRMGVLVDDLLLLARLDQGRPLEQEPVDLTRITTDAVDDLRVVAPDRFVDYMPNGSVVVPGDEVRLRQVLANLTQNAVRHTPDHTPIHVRVTADDTEAVIEVRDEGPGMRPDDAAQVFDRFWRSDESRVRTTGGAGLGLAIVSAIATAHGGRAEVITAPGEGAAFRIHLPRTPGAEAPETDFVPQA